MVEPASRDIPDPIKRAVRQRCGFGCVICGKPLYEYEHMLEFAVVKRHIAEEITLLCDQHHREKTVGLLPVQDVIDANGKPYNMRNGVGRPYAFHFHGTVCDTEIGSNVFTTEDLGDGSIIAPVIIDGVTQVGFKLSDGHLLLSLLAFDATNSLILEIHDSRLVYSVAPWDIEFVGPRLIIREAAGQILLDVVFEVPNKITISRGRFLCNDVEVRVYPDRLVLTNSGMVLAGCRIEDTPRGVVVGESGHGGPSMMVIPNVPKDETARPRDVKWTADTLAQSRLSG